MAIDNSLSKTEKTPYIQNMKALGSWKDWSNILSVISAEFQGAPNKFTHETHIKHLIPHPKRTTVWVYILLAFAYMKQ